MYKLLRLNYIWTCPKNNISLSIKSCHPCIAPSFLLVPHLQAMIFPYLSSRSYRIPLWLWWSPPSPCWTNRRSRSSPSCCQLYAEWTGREIMMKKEIKRSVSAYCYCKVCLAMIPLLENKRREIKTSTHHHHRWHAWHLASRSRHSARSLRRMCSGSIGESQAETSWQKTKRHNAQEFASVQNEALSRSCLTKCATLRSIAISIKTVRDTIRMTFSRGAYNAQIHARRKRHRPGRYTLLGAKVSEPVSGVDESFTSHIDIFSTAVLLE